MQTFFLILSFIQIIQNFNYLQQGRDWEGTCSSGQKQSPVDITLDQVICDDSMGVSMYFINQSYDVQREYPITSGSNQNDVQVIEINNVYLSDLYGSDVNTELWGYKAVKMSIHAPSEHTVEGQTYDVEVQIIHELQEIIRQNYSEQELSELNQYAVISILFQANNDPDFIAEQQIKDTTFFSTDRFDINNMSQPLQDFNPFLQLVDVYNSDGQFFFYEGSSTTPPCTENINWYVMVEPLPILQQQLDNINAFLKDNPEFAGGNGNNRETQDLNGRIMKICGAPCPVDNYPEVKLREDDTSLNSNILNIKIFALFIFFVYFYI